MRTKHVLGIVLAAILFLPSCAILIVAGRGCQWANRAVVVAYEEIDPAVLLRKYAWFKDAAAQLDKKRADIKVYGQRLSRMEADYQGAARKDWARTDKEQMSVWQSEMVGVKASYNALAAEYNAQMAKINWCFCNVGQLPKGATEPLPREYAPYVEQ